jgi:hypothetical protein
MKYVEWSSYKRVLIRALEQDRYWNVGLFVHGIVVSLIERWGRTKRYQQWGPGGMTFL